MPDPLLISTLVISIFTGITQLIQSYIDYKRDKLNNNNELYEVKNYSSSCCNINVDSDKETT
jgi:hypothetical protein